jgi:molybdate transport system substrate-binding protein
MNADPLASDRLTGISSMATRKLLADLCQAWAGAGGTPARFESVGGVEAARRVRAGERFDLVVLDQVAIGELAATGHVVAAGRTAIATSSVAIAVARGLPRPEIGSEAAVRAAVLAATRIAYSTGPSGTALLKLFERWGLGERLRERLVQAPPGTPVAALLASGRAELGFQQLSELRDEPGIELLGTLPPELAIVTTFVGAVATGSARDGAAAALLAFMTSPAAAEIKRRHGMSDARRAKPPIPSSTSPERFHDHRRSRPLHDCAAGARPLARPADREPCRSGERAVALRAEDRRRRAARVDRAQPAEEDGRARHRPDDLQPARELHGAPRRRLRDLGGVGGDLQRALPSRRPAVPRPLRRRGDAAAVARRRSGDLHSRARALRQGVRLRRHQPQPDPSGGHWTSPPLTDRHWYPLYEKMVEHRIPAMIHVSTSCNPCFHTTGAHYLNADTTAFMQCLAGDLFKDFRP